MCSYQQNIHWPTIRISCGHDRGIEVNPDLNLVTAERLPQCAPYVGRFQTHCSGINDPLGGLLAPLILGDYQRRTRKCVIFVVQCLLQSRSSPEA